MSNIAIFEETTSLPTVQRTSKLTDKMGSGGGIRRIGLNTNGTFKRIVNGEQIGKAIPHMLNVIVVDFLKDVSRTFYAGEYDPNAKPTMPDCWSNLGDKPDPKAKDPQGETCATCPQNVAGSGNRGSGKACRFQRRIAVIAEGDHTGEVYQLNIPAKSLFGKGVGAVHPFESYKNYLRANGEGLDTVVTKVMYDLDADTMTLKFRAVRHLTQEEADLVDAAQADPDTQRYIQLNVSAEGSTAEKPVAKPVAKVAPVFEDEEEETPPVASTPTKRASKKSEEAPAPKAKLTEYLNQWGDED
jgi:hypothetical protein